jgi:acyl-CoA thioesterase-1
MIGASLLVVTVVGCGSEGDVESPRDSPASSRMEEVEMTSGPLVMFLGDSLTAGYGLGENQAYPALLEQRWRAEGRSVRVVNAGISGDTTAGGLARIEWLLEQRPDVVVVELGANDGLRGLSLEETRLNLDEIIHRSLQAGSQILLVGMKIPPSYGPEYSTDFANLFGELAEARGVALLPFLLEGVAAIPDLNQADGIHPNAEGQYRLAENVRAPLEQLLDDL